MKIPLQITFRNMDGSEAIEKAIREKVEKLDAFFDQIMSCRVVVEADHRHHHKGNLYHVRVDITVPGGELVAGREPAQHQAHEDAYVAIRDAFDAAKRQLEDHARRRRQDVKTHDVPPHGKIAQLFPTESYGWIEASDGREVYFHKNSIVNSSFDELGVGTEVWFNEEAGEQGPQASTVHIVKKHHVG